MLGVTEKLMVLSKWLCILYLEMKMKSKWIIKTIYSLTKCASGAVKDGKVIKCYFFVEMKMYRITYHYI